MERKWVRLQVCAFIYIFLCLLPAAHDQNGRFVPKKPKVYTEESSGPTHFFTDDGMMGNSELKAVMKMATDLVSPQTMTRNRENHDGPSIAKKWKIGDVEGLVGSLLAFPGTGKEVAHVRVSFELSKNETVRSFCHVFIIIHITDVLGILAQVLCFAKRYPCLSAGQARRTATGSSEAVI